MNILKRIGAALGVAKPADEMAKAYPESALDPAQGFSGHPAKAFLGGKGIYAYRMEFAVFEADGARVIQAIASEFELASQDTFQEGSTRSGGKAVHFSLRPEFGGAVVVIVTNTIPLIEKIDALTLQPPPPWMAFPAVDPSTLGSLQGATEYWWDWLFMPFWSAADSAARARYLAKYPTTEDWLEFLALHAP